MKFEALDVERQKFVLAAEAIDYYTLETCKQKKFECIDCKQELHPVKEHLRSYNGQELVSVMSHFRHSADSDCERKGGESDLHKDRKLYLYSKLYEGKLKFKVGIATLEFERKDIDVEKAMEERQRIADVYIPFKEFNAILGNGIVIEIPVTEKEDSLIAKRDDWVCNHGSSYTWLPNRAWSGFELKEDIIQVSCVFIKQSKNSLREEFLRIRKEYEKVRLEISAMQKQTKYNCAVCAHSSPDNRHPDLLACWVERNLEKNGAPPERKLPTDHCGLWNLNEKKLKLQEAMQEVKVVVE